MNTNITSTIQSRATYLLIIGYIYSTSGEEAEIRKAIKTEIVKRLKGTNLPVFLFFSFFAAVFFYIDSLPVQEGPLEPEHEDIYKGVVVSVMIYTFVFLVAAALLRVSHAPDILKYLVAAVCGFTLYKTIRSFIRYILQK